MKIQKILSAMSCITSTLKEAGGRRQEAGGRRQEELREYDLFLIFFFDVEFYPIPHSLFPNSQFPIPHSPFPIYFAPDCTRQRVA
ncbi:MAG: hypothetical protein F6K41_02380 [Symploca sp. SIO3E6]|nr:hypothetical protein [Caldora sp. SIO3E6]